MEDCRHTKNIRLNQRDVHTRPCAMPPRGARNGLTSIACRGGHGRRGWGPIPFQRRTDAYGSPAATARPESGWLRTDVGRWHRHDLSDAGAGSNARGILRRQGAVITLKVPPGALQGDHRRCGNSPALIAKHDRAHPRHRPPGYSARPGYLGQIRAVRRGRTATQIATSRDFAWLRTPFYAKGRGQHASGIIVSGQQRPTFRMIAGIVFFPPWIWRIDPRGASAPRRCDGGRRRQDAQTRALASRHPHRCGLGAGAGSQ